MADIKNIRRCGITPDTIFKVVNNTSNEMKRIYRVVENQAVIVWDISPDEYTLIAIFNISAGEFTFPALESVSHIGVIDWGDGTTEEYDSSLRYTHTYSDNGTYEVKINCHIKSIKKSAFASNARLLSFSCTTAIAYGTNAFFRCALLENAIFSDGVTTLPSSIFLESGLINFEFPNNLKTIGYRAFYNSALAGEVIIPEGVTTIGVEAFESCNNITKIVFPDTMENFEIDSFSYRSDCLDYCSNLEEVVIGISQIALTTIPNYFCLATDAQNIKLHTIRIAEGVTKIGYAAFNIGAYGIDDCNVYLPNTIKELLNLCFTTYSGQTGHNHTLYVHYNGTVDEWTAISKGTNLFADVDVFLITSDSEKYEMNSRGEIT